MIFAQIQLKEESSNRSSTKHVNELSDSAVVSRGMTCPARCQIYQAAQNDALCRWVPNTQLKSFHAEQSRIVGLKFIVE